MNERKMLIKHKINIFKRYLRSKSKARASWSQLNSDNIECDEHSSEKILITTSTGSNWPCSSFDSLIALALKLRGAEVSFLLCDGVLPACQECDSQWISPKDIIESNIKSVCKDCFHPAEIMLKPLKINIYKYSDFISKDKISELSSQNDSNCDEHARAGTLRYYGVGEINSKSQEQVFQQFLSASKITKEVINNCVKKIKPTSVVLHHGIYVPQGIIASEISKNNINLCVWGPSYRQGTVLFSRHETYHHSMINEEKSLWDGYDFTKEKESTLMNYIHNKANGSNDWISYQSGLIESQDEIATKFNLDPSKKTIGLLTNVIWDAQLHFKNSCFDSMLDWLFHTIDFFKQSDNLQLLIRIHPAEVLGTVPSNQKVYDEIIKKYNHIPPNIRVILPSDKTCTYSAMKLCDCVLVYGTKTAVELSSLGQRVVIAGESWARGKGFTKDVENINEYEHLLQNINSIDKMDSRQIRLARKYAYHLFFRKMIPIKALEKISSFAPYKINVKNISELKVGHDKGLDTICNAILDKKEFIYDE